MSSATVDETTKNKIQTILWKAQEHVKEEEYAQAAKCFTRVLTFVKAPMPLLSRATCYLQLHEYDKAIDDCQQILQIPNIKIDPEIAPGCTTMHSAACTRMARAYYDKGEHQKSADYVNERKKIEEGKHRNSIFSDAQKAAAVDEIKEEGNKYFKKKDYLRAGAFYKKAIDMDPTNYILHSNQSQVLIHLNQLGLALFHAGECVRLKPDWPKGYYRQGIVLTKQKKYAEALEALRKAQELNDKDKSTDKSVNEAITEAQRLSGKQSFDGGNWWWLWVLAFVMALAGAGFVWSTARARVFGAGSPEHVEIFA